MAPRHAAALIVLSCATLGHAGGERSECPVANAAEYRIVAIRNGFRGGIPAAVDLGIGKGHPFDRDKVADAARELGIGTRQAAGSAMRDSNTLSLGFVTWTCEQVDPAKRTLSLVFHPVVITVSSSAGMVSFDSRPAASVPVNPEFRRRWSAILHPAGLLDYSPATRLSAGIRFSTQFTLPGDTGEWAIQASGYGLKSVSNSFYSAALDLRAVPPGGSPVIPALRLEASESPFFEQRFRTLTAHAGPVIERHLSRGFFSWVQIGGGVRVSRDRLTQDRNVYPAAIQNEAAGEWHVALDSFSHGGFTRVGFWMDAGKALDCRPVTGGAQAVTTPCNDAPVSRPWFQRYAFAAHHSRIVRVFGRSTDLEMIGGGGTSSGDWPPYRDYVGGYQYDFPLFESREGLSMSSVPYGPYMRSFGTRQEGPIVDSYLHANLTIGIPLPKLEAPVAPCSGGCAQEVASSLRTLRNLLVENYLMAGEDPKTAREHVRRDTRETAPVVSYLVERGTRYSVRPVFMMDMARLSGDEYPQPIYVLAAGPGLRIAWPDGRLEAGYMYSSGYRNRGSLIVRLRLDSLIRPRGLP